MSSSNWTERTELLIGAEKLEKLKQAHVLVVGLGGVGGVAAEMICRAGVGTMTIVDSDTVKPSNRNRQIIALCSTEGKIKADVLAERLLDINPELKLTVYDYYMKDEKILELLDNKYDYVVDAIDTLSPKVYFLFHATNRNLPIVSAMGAAGKIDPTLVRISDISESYNCKLAYYLRKKLHKLGVKTGIKVVYSAEVVPKNVFTVTDGNQNKKSIVGTISYMPAVFGCYAASVVIRDLTV